MAKTWAKHLLIGVAVVIAMAALYVSATAHLGGTRDRSMLVRAGDDAAWAEPTYDDSDWNSYTDWQIETGAFSGNLWVRQTVQLEDDPSRNTFVLFATGSSEVYFDGVLIGRNGTVGTDRASEEPGSMRFLCTIPRDLLTAGTHQVAIRFSNHRGIGRFFVLGGGVGSLQDVLSFTQRSLFPFLFLGAFVVVALYFGALYLFNRRQTSHLIFSFLCLLTAVLLSVESMRALGYPYYLHIHRLIAVVTISAFLSGCVPTFFILRHDLQKKWLYGVPIILAVAAGLFQLSTDHMAFGFFSLTLLYSQFLLCRSIWEDRAEAWLGLLGVSQTLVVLTLTRLSFMERGLFGSFTILMVMILISLGLQLKRQRAEFEEAKLRSARLQIELLKKHLQPHFVLNTLTAVMEWLERDPKAGIAFVDLLAKEMKALNRISGETLVALDDELNLCRNHLQILAYRNDETYSFETDCPNLDLMIPPALILTLVENGISYALDEAPVRFKLKQELTTAGHIHLCFEAIGVDIGAGQADEGTGSKYIKARLEESFPRHWSLEAGGHNQTWTTRIHMERLT